MVGMYIIGGFILVGIGVLTFFRIKWNKADKALFRARADKLEKERLENIAGMEANVAKTEAGN
jgi:hypothetical protein